MTAVLTNPAPLDITDRCDRCGSQAFIRATKDSLPLTFCGHHGKKVMDALTLQGFIIDDFTSNINEKPSPST